MLLDIIMTHQNIKRQLHITSMIDALVTPSFFVYHYQEYPSFGDS